MLPDDDFMDITGRVSPSEIVFSPGTKEKLAREVEGWSKILNKIRKQSPRYEKVEVKARSLRELWA